MSKVITSPVKRWPGSVTLADPLTFPQFIAWRDAVRAASEHRGDLLRYSEALLPGVRACVEKWELANFKPDPFPATPRQSSDRLLAWLVREINAIASAGDDEDEDPK